MSKVNNKLNLHWIHFVAGLVLGSYFLLSKVNTLYALTYKNIYTTFFQIYLFGIFFACLFLFLFSHEKFFPFMKEIENREKVKERKYLRKYIKHGKVLATLLIGTIGGPIFSSLTARILLSNEWYKYFVVILANIPSTFVTVGLIKPFISVFGF